MNLATLIKAEQERRGWSLRQLADKCGLATSVLHRIVTNSSEEPRMSTLAAISEALELPFSRLVEAAGYPITDVSPDEEVVAVQQLAVSFPEFRCLAQYYERLDYQNRMSVLAMARALVETEEQKAHQMLDKTQ